MIIIFDGKIHYSCEMFCFEILPWALQWLFDILYLFSWNDKLSWFYGKWFSLKYNCRSLVLKNYSKKKQNQIFWIYSNIFQRSLFWYDLFLKLKIYKYKYIFLSGSKWKAFIRTIEDLKLILFLISIITNWS